MDLSLRNLRKNIAAFSVVALLASLLAVNVAFAAASDVYEDVDGSEWYAPYVDWGLDNGVLDDTQAYFRAGDNASRAEFFKMTAAGAGVVEGTCDETLFPDLDASHWACGWITGMAEAGIISGDGSASATPDHVRPNDNITRAEAAKVAVATFVLVGDGTMGAEYFSDVPADAWYNEYMGIAAYNCVFQGNDGAVSPGDFIVRAEAMAVESRSATPTTDCTIAPPVDAGALTVTVDGSTPSTMDIPLNGSNILYTVFAFEASADEDLRVEELILTRQGLGLPGDFDSVKLYVDGVQMGSQKTVNTSTNTSTFSLAGDPIIVPAGSMVLVEVRGDMDAAENSQNTFCLMSGDDALVYGESSNAEVTVGGSFAACGEWMTTTSASVGTLTYEIDDYTGDINIGETGVSAAKLKLEATNVEDIDVTKITFKQRGSADPEDFSNEALYMSGMQIADNPTWDGDFLTFDLSADPIYIERGNSENVELRLDVVGGLGSDMLFEIYREWNIEGTGTVYHYGVNVEEETYVSPATPPVTVARDIIGGNLAFALSAENPTVGDMLGDADDHEFLNFNVSTGGESVTLLGFDINIVYNDIGDYSELQDLKVWTKNSADEWVSFANTDPAAGAVGGLPDTLTLSFTDSWDLAAGTTTPFMITLDGNNATDLNEYSVEFLASTVDAEYSDGTTIDAADISGGTLSGNVQTITDPTLTIETAAAPSDMDVVGGTQDVEPINWDFKASSAADVLVTNITVTCDYADLSADGDSCADSMANAELFIKDGSTYTSIDTTSISTGILTSNVDDITPSADDIYTSTMVFNGVNLDVPAGQIVKIALRLNTSKAADAFDIVDFYINGAAEVSAEYSDGTITPTGTISAWRTVSFIGAGTLTVSVDGNTPSDETLPAGASDVLVSKVKLTADVNEDILVQDLRLTNTFGPTQDAFVSGIRITDGTDTYYSSLSNGIVEFDFGTGIVVPKDTTVTLDVLVDTTAITTGGADSGVKLELVVEDISTTYANYEESTGTDMDIKAVGYNSGIALDYAAGIDDGTGYTGAGIYSLVTSAWGDFILRNNVPLFTVNGDLQPSGASIPSIDQEVLVFDVSVDGNGTSTISSLTFVGAGSPIACTVDPTSPLYLYRVTTGGDDLISTSTGDLTIAGPEFDNGVGLEVDGGDVITLKLKGDTRSCVAVNDDSLEVNLVNVLWDDGKNTGPILTEVELENFPVSPVNPMSY